MKKAIASGLDAGGYMCIGMSIGVSVGSWYFTGAAIVCFTISMLVSLSAIES